MRRSPNAGVVGGLADEFGLVRIEVVMERHDVVAQVTGEPSLLDRTVHADCAVGPSTVTGLPPMVHTHAPAERLAALRIVVGVFAVSYLVLRVPVFLELRDRSADDLDAVGLFRWLDEPVPDAVSSRSGSSSPSCRVSRSWPARGSSWPGPVFAVAMLALCTYRSSWGQMLHFENLFVMHLLVIGVAASADAWSLDARRRRRPRRTDPRAARLLVAAAPRRASSSWSPT